MKKARKGLTLVEVVVAIAVFAVISVVLITTYVSLARVNARQEEYTRLDMASHDMMAYFDAYGESWDEEYFLGFAVDAKYGYLNSDFEPCSLNDKDMKYIIKYEVVDGRLNILQIKSDTFVYAEDGR